MKSGLETEGLFKLAHLVDNEVLLAVQQFCCICHAAEESKLSDQKIFYQISSTTRHVMSDCCLPSLMEVGQGQERGGGCWHP